jgi:hypothetical protein
VIYDAAPFQVLAEAFTQLPAPLSENPTINLPVLSGAGAGTWKGDDTTVFSGVTTVGVHIRMGDFAQSGLASHLKYLPHTLPNPWWKKAIAWMLKRLPKTKPIVFNVFCGDLGKAETQGSLQAFDLCKQLMPLNDQEYHVGTCRDA